jgi:hypothetical protein
MALPQIEGAAAFRRIGAEELERALATPAPPLVLDVRRGEAFAEQPGVPGALPLALDREPLLLPDTDRDRLFVVY